MESWFTWRVVQMSFFFLSWPLSYHLLPSCLLWRNGFERGERLPMWGVEIANCRPDFLSFFLNDWDRLLRNQSLGIFPPDEGISSWGGHDFFSWSGKSVRRGSSSEERGESQARLTILSDRQELAVRPSNTVDHGVATIGPHWPYRQKLMRDQDVCCDLKLCTFVWFAVFRLSVTDCRFRQGQLWPHTHTSNHQMQASPPYISVIQSSGYDIETEVVMLSAERQRCRGDIIRWRRRCESPGDLSLHKPLETREPGVRHSCTIADTLMTSFLLQAGEGAAKKSLKRSHVEGKSTWCSIFVWVVRTRMCV